MATRRGFGALRRLPSKRWQASYTGPDLGRHTAPHTFDSKADAEAWLVHERALVEGEGWVAPKRRIEVAERLAPPTFGEYARQWLADRSLKPRTVEGYEHLLRRYLEPEFGDLLVSNLTPAVVRRWWAGLSPDHPTVNARAYALLRAVLTTAVGEELLASNPCRVRGASNPPTKKQIRPATLDELDVLVEEMPDQFGALVLLCAWCALRVGEVLELRRRDLDLDRGLVKVTRAVSWVRGQPVIGTPKSAAGTREVSLPPHIVPALKQHLEQHVLPEAGALLFPSRSDHRRHLQPTVLHTAWREARSAAGRDDLRIHDMRHTGATMAAMTGATLAELQARLGHSTVAAALRYQHAAQGRDAEIAARLSDLAWPKND
ncbi:integrase [Serinicoccus sp. CUA-874]|uniref:tyrosine-type recombinase/integrase n=1 Tax=Serinicoccus sp. CUA-874 TaxID=1517939 RepID=UPI0009611FA2|nr:site-specific integrase [Serinicoccus sp. CUA-874]OLT15716.1 integrase [Serinicoccus sp. CUA-874]